LGIASALSSVTLIFFGGTLMPIMAKMSYPRWTGAVKAIILVICLLKNLCSLVENENPARN